MFFLVGCPLLLFWPLVHELRGYRTSRSGGGEDGDEVVMEMRLRENPQQFSSALLQLAARYLFINGAQVNLHSVCSFFFFFFSPLCVSCDWWNVLKLI